MDVASTPLFELADAWLAHLDAGGDVDPEAFLAQQGRQDPQALELLRMVASVESERGHLPGPGDTVGPYRVEERVGHGGMGVVYRARDDRLERDVALKVCRRSMAGEAGAERFLREARALARLDHPHIVAIHDLGETPHWLWYAMEFVRGETVDALMDRGALPADPAILARRFADVARALHAAHEAGVVHRDVKPANILVAGPERWVLTDFGVAHWDTLQTITGTQDLPGTPAWMAPEQLEGNAPSPAMDIYALSAVLYEALTGFWPPRRWSLARIFRDRHNLDLPSPSTLRRELPASLEQALATGLAVDPHARHASAAALADALDGVDSTPARVTPPALPLVGRDAELAVLQGAWQDALTGTGQVLAVEGPFGVGRSRLLDHFASTLRPTEADVLRGAARPGHPAALLADALRRRFGDGDVASSLTPHLQDRPALAERLATLVAQGTASDPSHRWPSDALGVGLRAVMASLAKARPVLWILDDVHLADDEATRRAVVALASEARRHRVMAVLVLETPLSAEDTRWLAALRPQHRIPLAPLGVEDVRVRAEQVLEDPGLAHRLAGALHVRTHGLPLLVENALAALAASPASTDTGEALRHLPPEGEDLDQSLSLWIDGRLAGLRADERHLLEVGAVEGECFQPDLAARVVGTTRLAVLRTLADIAARTGLVQCRAHWTDFALRPVRDRLCEGLPPDLRAEIHGALVDACLAAAEDEFPRQRTGRDPDPGFLAHHALRSGNPKRALPWVPAAMDALRARHRALDASHLAGRAAEVAGGAATDEGLTLLLQQVTSLLDIGAAADADRILTALEARSDRADAPHLQVRLRRLRGAWHRHGSRWDEAREVLHAALADAEALTDAPEVAAIHTLLGAVELGDGDVVSSRAHFLAALEHARAQPPGRARWVAHLNVANTYRQDGELGPALEHVQSAMDTAREVVGKRLPAYLVSAWCQIRLALGHVDEVQSAAQQVLETASTRGDLRMCGITLGILANCAWERGTLDEGIRLAEEAQRVREAAGERIGAAYGELVLADFHGANGDLPAQLEALDRADAHAVEMRAPQLASIVACLRAAAGQGDAGDAVAAVSAMRQRMGRLDRIATCHALWMATGDPVHLDDAWQDLEHVVAHAPEADREGLLDRVRVYRAVQRARETGSREGRHDDGPTTAD